MGINILYDLARIDIDEKDPYDLTGYYFNNTVLSKYSMEELRPLLKQVLMIMTNSKSSVQALKALEKDVNDSDNKFPGDVNLKELMNAFRKRHLPIKNYFFSNIGNVQYFFDSTVTSNIINRFTLQGVPVLTIHDSYVIDVMNAGELIEIMESYYQTTLKKYVRTIKYKIENKQYKQIHEDIMDGKEPKKYISPHTTKQTKDDWIVLEGFGWGHRRQFKDKNYKKRISEWLKAKTCKERDYYFNEDYNPDFLESVLTKHYDKQHQINIEYKYSLSEYYKKYPERKPKKNNKK